MRKTSLNCIYELAKQNSNIVYIGSDLGAGVLDEMKAKIPNQFYMEGISEQHVIGMSAGMAMEGFIPYVNTIATFLTRRCFEQIALDLCLHDLPVKLIANGGGVVYAPLGPTHLAVEDIAILRTLPNMTIVAPCDAEEMKRLMPLTVDYPHPMYIRLAKGGDKIVSSSDNGFAIGKAILMKQGIEALFITTGITTQVALDASELLQAAGISAGVLHMHTIKPLDHDSLKSILPHYGAIITVEEHTRIGGLGSAVLEFCNDYLPDMQIKIKRMGLPDKFSEKYGTQDAQLNYSELSKTSLSKAMAECISAKQ